MEEKKTGFLKAWIDKIQGDKVVWMILALLILFSIVSIFASTSLLAIEQSTTRMAIFKEQLMIVGFGIGLVGICYILPSIWLIRVLSQLGFVVSFGLLTILLAGLGSVEFNGAVRALRIGGAQLHVYEVVKVAMVMYLAWAVHTYKEGKFRAISFLAKRFPSINWVMRPVAQRFIYIFIPMMVVCAMVAMGSLSSALFIGGVMVVTILIGGIEFKHLILPAVVALMGAGALVGLHEIAPDKILPRMNTWKKRFSGGRDYKQDVLTYKPSEKEFRDAIDKLRQPEGAKMAIKEGGLFGKGPGKSTQKYVVAVMFGDYMFSFIVEEYGLWGAILVIMLYVSLLARGSLIAKSCEGLFGKTAVAGLTILISGQALFHMIINIDVGILTGQTLPIISHGNSSFLCFCIAFGIILSISKLAKSNMEAMQVDPIVASVEENVQSSLNELDDFDSNNYNHEI
jgi:cell division protein FtsW